MARSNEDDDPRYSRSRGRERGGWFGHPQYSEASRARLEGRWTSRSSDCPRRDAGSGAAIVRAVFDPPAFVAVGAMTLGEHRQNAYHPSKEARAQNAGFKTMIVPKHALSYASRGFFSLSHVEKLRNVTGVSH
jgi:hypothetical protein